MAKRQVWVIRVPKFDQYNQKSAGKVQTWLRVENTLARSSKFLSLSHGAKLLWLWLLCECSKSRTREAHVNNIDISREIHVKPMSVPSAIYELMDLEWIQIVKSPYERTNERYERTNETDIRAREQVALVEAPEPPPPLPSTHVVASLHPLAVLWNQNRGQLPEVKACAGQRAKKAAVRFKEQTPDQWVLTIQRLASSAFCTGKNERGWRADFDFLLKPDTWQKANDGKYDNGPVAASRTRATAVYDNLDAIERELIGGAE